MPTPAEIILAKIPLPTHLDSAGLRERWAAEIRRRAFFSARMASMGYIRTLQRVCAAYAEGTINAADARMRLRGVLDALGLSDGSGGLTDHGSDRRLGLILDTQRQMAATAARLELQTPEVLAQWPAWRLTRFVGRSVPRDDWPRRWRAAGEAVGWQGASRTRMVALKASPIWKALGDGAGGFKDTLGNPYPPFAYGSGMDWEDVGAEEAQRLGLPTASAAPQKASLDPADREILEAMRKTGLRAEDFLPPETRTVRNAAPCHAKDPANCPYHGTGKYAGEGDTKKPAETRGTTPAPKATPAPKVELPPSPNPKASAADYRKANRTRGEAALKTILETHADVPAAMISRKLGPIDFVWGWPGTEAKKYHDGYGFSHIIAAHGEEAAKRVPEILAHGKYFHDEQERDAYTVVFRNEIVSVKRKRGNFLVVTSYASDKKATAYVRRGGQIENKAKDDSATF